MSNTKRLLEINKELKVYINESSFISQKCRNQVLKIFSEEFQMDFDIGSYQNVDLSIQEDFRVLYREDFYESKNAITSFEEMEERYQHFQERADKLIKRKDIDFEGRRNFHNFTNLVVVICFFLLIIAFLYFGILAFLSGDYFDCLWFVIVVLPWLIPKIKDSLINRITQAKNYLKSLLKKVK